MVALPDGRASGVGHGTGPPVLPTGPAPALVQRLAAGRVVTPVWANLIGQVTWRLGVMGDSDYVKHGTPHPEFDPVAEAARLAWVSRHVPAPEVIGHGAEPDGTVWLLTRGLPGHSAVSKEVTVGPERVVTELGRALRRFHDSVPVDGCPFGWSVRTRIEDAPRPELVDGLLGQAPPVDPVVAHGDACNPNFLIDADGRFTGYVDLGRLGVADRWADLQPAIRSLSWNFPEVEPEVFLSAYGIAMDEAKYAFYLELWNNGA